MKKRKYSLTGLLWTLKNNGIIDICKNVERLKDDMSAVLILEKRKYDSDFIMVERTSEKCFRISGIVDKASFTKANLACKHIAQIMVDYYQAVADYNARIRIDNSAVTEKLNRLRNGK